MYSFEESQRFRQSWMWLLMFAIIGFLVILVLVTFGTIFSLVPFVTVSAPVAMAIFLYYTRLDTRADETGLYYKFYLQQFNEKKIEWPDVAEAYIREYRAMIEYRGWGIKYTVVNGRAYIVSGDKGLQIVMKNGNKILIGTQKPDELNELLQHLIKDKIVTLRAPKETFEKAEQVYGMDNNDVQ